MADFVRRAAVWRSSDGWWVSEKGTQYSEFKVLAVTQSPFDPEKDSEHRTWREAMDNALEFVSHPPRETTDYMGRRRWV